MPIPTTVMLCPVCGNPFRQMRREWLFKCTQCGLLASTLEPSIPQQRSKTLINEKKRLTGLCEARKATNTALLRILSSILGQNSGTLLDVGCGHGLFLKDALTAGFRCEGIEPDANVVDEARIATGATIRHGYFPNAIDDHEKLDAIVFNDVLEHIPDLESTMKACNKHLRTGGILVLNCPDQGGAFYRVADALDRLGFSGPFHRMWQHRLPSPHVWYFAADHLVQLGTKYGFDRVEVLRLPPITARGLWERISYVQGQPLLINGMLYLGARVLLPLLRILPRDTSIVFLAKVGNGPHE